LVLVGGGDMVGAYTELAHQLGIGARTHFVGWVPNDQLAPYYGAADVVVVPSVRVEAFGLVVIEALACGTPVVASELPGLRAVVRSTNGGLLVPPGDPDALANALASLLADAPLRATLAARGRAAVVQHYDWSVIGDRLEAVYRAVLSEQGVRLNPTVAVGAER
jgi:glycosyltransferase involved in cell wall biosynthesis